MTNRAAEAYRQSGFPRDFMLATGLDSKSDQCLILPPAATIRRILCSPSHSLRLSDVALPERSAR